jgi:hypothetical protein
LEQASAQSGMDEYREICETVDLFAAEGDRREEHGNDHVANSGECDEKKEPGYVYSSRFMD